MKGSLWTIKPDPTFDDLSLPSLSFSVSIFVSLSLSLCPLSLSVSLSHTHTVCEPYSQTANPLCCLPYLPPNDLHSTHSHPCAWHINALMHTTHIHTYLYTHNKHMKHTVLVFLLLWLKKEKKKKVWQKQLGVEIFFPAYSHNLSWRENRTGTQSRNSKAGTEVKVMDKCYLLDSFSWLAQSAFIIASRTTNPGAGTI